MRPSLEAPSDLDLQVEMAVGLGVAAVSYAFAFILAHSRPHSIAAVDSIPIVGAVASVARDPHDDQLSSALLASAGIQAIGLLVAVATGVDLMQRARVRVDIGCSASGGELELTWRY